jgi:hypothetical protein
MFFIISLIAMVALVTAAFVIVARRSEIANDQAASARARQAAMIARHDAMGIPSRY